MRELGREPTALAARNTASLPTASSSTARISPRPKACASLGMRVLAVNTVMRTLETAWRWRARVLEFARSIREARALGWNEALIAALLAGFALSPRHTSTPSGRYSAR